MKTLITKFVGMISALLFAGTVSFAQNPVTVSGKVIGKEGLPLDHALKQDPKNLEKDKIGLSKGVTVNLGDYQSMRVDCWLTTSLIEGETEQQALNRISTIIDDRVNLEVDKVKSNM